MIESLIEKEESMLGSKTPQTLTPQQVEAIQQIKKRKVAKPSSEAIEGDDAKNKYKSGLFYLLGEGVLQDFKEAVRLYRLAVKQDNAIAQTNLGLCYELGEGVEQDFKEAARLFRLATNQGNATAQAHLGYCYEKGLGVTKDPNEAWQNYRLAVRNGYPNFDFSRSDLMKAHGLPWQKESDAKEELKKSLSLNSNNG